MRDVAIVVFGAVVTALGGCALVLGFEDTSLRPDATEEGGPAIDGTAPGADAAHDAAASRLSVVPSPVVVHRGATASVLVSLERGADIEGPVNVTVDGLPSGVAAATATIAGEATSTTLTFTAAPTAALGASDVRVSIDKGALAPVVLPLLVSDPPGSLDVTFDTDGVTSDPTSGRSAAFFAVAVQPDRKIVAGGVGQLTPGWLVRRFDASGSPDVPFNAAVGTLPREGEVRGVAIDPTSSKIVLAGTSPGALGQSPQLTVIRRDPSGAADPTFAAGGAFVFAFADAPLGSTALAVAVEPDGSVVVVGSRREAGGEEAGVAIRLRADGSRDPQWNGGAPLVVPRNRFVGVATDAQRAVYIAGTDVAQPGGSYWLSKRTAAGAPDPTFGVGGVVTLGFGVRARTFVRMPDGSLVLAGDNGQASNAYTMARADARGAQVFLRSLVGTAGASLHGVTGQADGRTIAVGHAPGIGGEALVERVLPDGGRDPTFGDGGASLLDDPQRGKEFDLALFAAATQPDGRIVVAGSHTELGAVIYRLWP